MAGTDSTSVADGLVTETFAPSLPFPLVLSTERSGNKDLLFASDGLRIPLASVLFVAPPEGPAR